MNATHTIDPHFGLKVWDLWTHHRQNRDVPEGQTVALHYHHDTDTWFLVVGSVAVPMKDDDVRSLASAIGWVLP